MADFWNDGGRTSKNLILRKSNENTGKYSQIYFFFECWKLTKDIQQCEECLLEKMAES